MSILTSLKQPHEDVHPMTIPELQFHLIKYSRPLVTMANHLYAACLVGNKAPVVQRMYDRITNPQIGDLVTELTTRHRRNYDQLRATGYLIEKREEWCTTDEEWEKDKEEWEKEYEEDSLTRGTDIAWYIQYGIDSICRWTNCSFIVIPVNVESFHKPVGVKDGNGVLITKDSLLDSLSDSGFNLHLLEKPQHEQPVDSQP